MKEKLERIIEHHQKFSKSYFWNPPRQASGRRWMEKQNSWTEVVEFGQDKLEVESKLSCSCSYVYYRLVVKLNGKKKDIRAVKSMLYRLTH